VEESVFAKFFHLFYEEDSNFFTASAFSYLKQT